MLKKTWLVWVMLVCMLFTGAVAYADSNPIAPGLLRWQPGSSPAGMQYGATDGNLQSYVSLQGGSIVWTFPRPVDLTGFAFYADSPDAQLYMIDANGVGLAAAGASTTVPTAPFAVSVNGVKSIRVSPAVQGEPVRVYELDVYGSLSRIVPNAPTGLVATGGDRIVKLDWNAEPNATGYKVKRSSMYGGPYSVIRHVYGTTHFQDGTVTNGMPYYYVVSAFNEFGESADSSQAYAYPVLHPPAAPTHLTASPGDGQVMLQWETVTGAVYYNVKRADSPGGPFKTVTQTVYGYYADRSAENGTTYTYIVTALNGAGESYPSNAVTAVPVAALPDRAMLVVTLADRVTKEYDLPLQEADAFVAWYAQRSGGSGPSVYALDRHDNNRGPFASRTDYIRFDSIVSFEVNAYKSD
ncbi:fibronectin type III domain-containing protein [Paenibacillus sp. GYB003]|uniref:fibronectin type III domain-containing protein n=1 Tax=Paenibacillus sp. GYB003 TaxID=2994392 RepID=UPI002F96B787